MSVHPRKARKGKRTWEYCFDAPDSKPEKRIRVTGGGFKTKGAAQDAEAIRRVEVQKEYEARRLGRASVPRTLDELLKQYCDDCENRQLAPKTIAVYRNQIRYISSELSALQIREITTLHLHKEWIRLSKSGGLGRRKGKPLSTKTVRNIAGIVSGAYSRAIFWGLTDRNPVENSEPPKVRKREIKTLTAEQEQLFLSSSMHHAIPFLLETLSATGARRGEGLALAWTDIRDGRVTISRSLSQVGKELIFKGAKKDNVRLVTLPEWYLPLLESHREQQMRFRAQFGEDYRTELDLIICNPDGSPLKPDSISASVSALRKRLKLPAGISLHSTRHTHATNLLADGMEVTAVAARLGHKDVSTTLNVYGHAIRQRDDEAAKLINKRRLERDARKGADQ